MNGDDDLIRIDARHTTIDTQCLPETGDQKQRTECHAGTNRGGAIQQRRGQTQSMRIGTCESDRTAAEHHIDAPCVTNTGEHQRGRGDPAQCPCIEMIDDLEVHRTGHLSDDPFQCLDVVDATADPVRHWSVRMSYSFPPRSTGSSCEIYLRSLAGDALVAYW